MQETAAPYPTITSAPWGKMTRRAGGGNVRFISLTSVPTMADAKGFEPPDLSLRRLWIKLQNPLFCCVFRRTAKRLRPLKTPELLRGTACFPTAKVGRYASAGRAISAHESGVNQQVTHGGRLA